MRACAVACCGLLAIGGWRCGGGPGVGGAAEGGEVAGAAKCPECGRSGRGEGGVGVVFLAPQGWVRGVVWAVVGRAGVGERGV